MIRSASESISIMRGNPLPVRPLRFFGICLVAIVLVNFLPDAALAPLNNTTAKLSALCIALFGRHADIIGNIVSLDGFRVSIVAECTALYGIVLFGAFLYSTPAAPRSRATGFIAGAISLICINILRIAAVTIVGASRPALFELVHVYLGQVVMMLAVVGLALAWQSRQSDTPDPFPFIVRAGFIATLFFLPWMTVHIIYIDLLDRVVEFIFSLIHSEYLLHIPRPPHIYNHTFEVPFFLALVLASRGVPLRRRLIGAGTGLFIIAGWNMFFRVTHVIWTAYGVEGLQPWHNLVYLLGQYLLPIFLWLLIINRPLRVPKRFISGIARFAPLLILFIALVRPASARAGILVTIESGGRGAYTLRAVGLKGITGGDIRINYETDGQTLPTVKAAGLVRPEQMRAAVDSPGIIDIHLAPETPLNGNGDLAAIALPSHVTSLSAWLQNDQGVTESVRTRFTNPPEEKEKPNTPAAPPPLRGMKGNSAVEQVVPVSPSAQSSVPSLDKAGAVRGWPQSPVPLRRLEGALDRFCGYAGEWNPEALDRVFAPVGDGEFRQKPALFLTDGLAEMEVTYRVKREGETVICFLIKGARCSSLLARGTGEWLLVLTPERGTVSASVTVLTNLEMDEYPLTVATPLPLIDSVTAEEELPCRREYVIAANERARTLHSDRTGQEGSKQ